MNTVEKELVMTDDNVVDVILCDICGDEEGSEHHATHGFICHECSDDLADIDDEIDTTSYDKNIQKQIDAEPEIHIPEGE